PASTGVVQCTLSTAGSPDPEAAAAARYFRRLRTGRGTAPTRPTSPNSIVWNGLNRRQSGKNASSPLTETLPSLQPDTPDVPRLTRRPRWAGARRPPASRRDLPGHPASP